MPVGGNHNIDRGMHLCPKSDQPVTLATIDKKYMMCKYLVEIENT